MDKFVIIAIFIVVLSGFLIVIDKPSSSKKKLTGRGGDFEE